MLKALIRIEMRQFADLISRNERFLKKVQGYKKSFDLHEQARSIDKKKEKKYIEESSNAKIAAELYQQSKCICLTQIRLGH